MLIVGCGDVGLRAAALLAPRVRLLAVTSSPAATRAADIARCMSRPRSVSVTSTGIDLIVTLAGNAAASCRS